MKNIYINLAIRNVDDTDKFFSSLGLVKNMDFASEDTTNARLNNTTSLMLLEDKKLESFTGHKTSEKCNNKTIALEFDSKDKVDEFFNKAIESGAEDTTKNSSESEGFMYGKSFRDINGHLWELFAFLQKS